MEKIIKKVYHFISMKNTPDYCWKFRKNALSCRGIFRYVYIYKWIRTLNKNNASIPLSVDFAGKPTFPHGFHGIFISSGAKIGVNCTIFHQVTIGSNTLADTKHPGAPTIGDNVYIGAGAKIVGGIHVGNNVRIGANCVVTKDIPDNSTVVLSEPRIITRKSTQNNYFVDWETYLQNRPKCVL